jgi:hypothetical protein
VRAGFEPGCEPLGQLGDGVRPGDADRLEAVLGGEAGEFGAAFDGRQKSRSA